MMGASVFDYYAPSSFRREHGTGCLRERASYRVDDAPALFKYLAFARHARISRMNKLRNQWLQGRAIY